MQFSTINAQSESTYFITVKYSNLFNFVFTIITFLFLVLGLDYNKIRIYNFARYYQQISKNRIFNKMVKSACMKEIFIECIIKIFTKKVEKLG